MKRLERECLAASLILHTVLLGVLVVGSGFSARVPPTEEVTLLTFIPDYLTDSPFQEEARPRHPRPSPRRPLSRRPLRLPPRRHPSPRHLPGSNRRPNPRPSGPTRNPNLRRRPAASSRTSNP
ncbi:MAG: hypothetical protein M5U12_15875 [Verrucomicrobia bacterium]|nr:hypothetical protein [Verrucomicrobiota bacterium]